MNAEACLENGEVIRDKQSDEESTSVAEVLSYITQAGCFSAAPAVRFGQRVILQVKTSG